MSDKDVTPEPDDTTAKLSDELVDEAKTEEPKDQAPADTEDEAASQDEETGDDAAEDEGKAEGEKPAKAKPKVQKRIDELTKAKHDAERRAERLQAELERARLQPPVSDIAAPDANKYEQGTADPEYLSDLTIYKMEKRREAERKTSAQHDAELRQKELARDWAARTADATSRYDDFEAVAMNSKLPVSDEMAVAIQESDIGPDVLYWLGQNPSEARRIFTLTPVKQAIEIGKIETFIEGNEGVAPLPKKLTAAPPPAKRLHGGTTPQKDPAKMSMEEYRAFRAKKTA